jgi:hypothetical protein
MQLFKKRIPQPPQEPTTQPLPTIQTRTDFPFGTVVETENGWFFLKDKTRLRIPTQKILDSWSVNVVQATESAVKHYIITGKLGFRDGTLINNWGDGKIYLISKNQRRQLTSPDALLKYGLDRGKMIEVSAEEAELQSIGEVLS